jgi:predicted Zn-dependent peptidase
VAREAEQVAGAQQRRHVRAEAREEHALGQAQLRGLRLQRRQEFDLFQNVTLADVQRVARTYFTPEARMLLTVLPGAGAGPAGGRP